MHVAIDAGALEPGRARRRPIRLALWTLSATLLIGLGRPGQVPGPALAADALDALVAASRSPNGDSSALSRDDGHGLRFDFGLTGVSISPSSGESTWGGSLSILSYACGNAVSPFERESRPRSTTATDRLNARARAGEARFVEWFASAPIGLEHGLTLVEGACLNGDIELRIGVNGFTPTLRPDGRGVDLRDSGGSVRLHYTNLFAEDAKHAALPARMLVDDGAVVLRIDVRGASLPITVDPLVWAAPQKLYTAGMYAEFGSAAALSGTTAIFGAPNGNKNNGAAYVSTESNGTWSQPTAMLVASDGVAADNFGASVAISGTTAVVGAPDANAVQGKAYVFTQQPNGTWAQQGSALTAPDGAAGDAFGTAVGISASGAILVGAPNATATFMGIQMGGKVYVFTPMAGGGFTSQILTATNLAGPYLFGTSIAVSGSEAIIGAPGALNGNGQAYVFSGQADGSWTPSNNPLSASDGASGDRFGAAVAISGSEAIVGAPGATVSGEFLQGKAYVFEQSGSAWAQQGAPLVSNTTFVMYDFGSSVAISGTTAIVGAPGSSDALYAVQGAAYAFTQTAGTFVQPASVTLSASDGFAGDGFGTSVAAAGSTVLVGAPAALVLGASEGAAYIGPLLSAVGSTCSAGSQCAGGNCVTGYCCSSACAGPCTTCQSGTCAPIKSADDPNGCTGASTCSATGACGLKNGQAATGASSCASGQLADGVCCDMACSGACNACTAALGAPADGTCGTAKRGSPSASCPAYLCNGSSAACPAACAADADCAEGYYCRSDKTCQPQKAKGATCDPASAADCFVAGCRECASGFCVDGVCCGTACSKCQACAVALQASGGVDGVCSAALQGTDPRANCASNSTCNGSGACGLKSGQAATSPNACASGYVADGVCCASACGQACEVCSASKGAPADGTCAPAPQGSAGAPACGSGVACNGTISSCPGAACTSDGQCLAGFYCGGSGTCQPQKSAGAACNVTAGAKGDCLESNCNECQKGSYCVDGVCCASASCEACQACSAQLQAPGGMNGVCKAALSGTTPHGDCAATSTCNGAGACGLQDGQPATVATTCASGFVANGVCCDQPCSGNCEVCRKALGAGADGTCTAVVSSMACDGGAPADAGLLAADSGVDAAHAPSDSGASTANDGAATAARDAATLGDATASAATDAEASAETDGARSIDAASARLDAQASEAGGGAADGGDFLRERPDCSCHVAGAENDGRRGLALGAAISLLAVARRRRARTRSTARRWRHPFARLVFACALAWSARAEAQASDAERAAARALATEGYKSIGEQRWADAVDRFTRAEALIHAPAHLLYLGRALVHLGKYVAAHEAYLKLAREVLPPTAPAAAIRAQKDGAQELAALEPKMASLVMTIRPASARAAITMDGAPVPSAMIGVAIPVDPGSHTLRAEAAGYAPSTRETVASEGAQATVTLELLPLAASRPTEALGPTSPERAAGTPTGVRGFDRSPGASGALRTAGYAALAFSAVAVGAGVVFVVESHAKRTDGDDLCPMNVCPASQASRLDSLNHDATLFGVLAASSFVVAGAAAAGGLTAIVLSSHGPASSGQTALTAEFGRIDLVATW